MPSKYQKPGKLLWKAVKREIQGRKKYMRKIKRNDEVLVKGSEEMKCEELF